MAEAQYDFFKVHKVHQSIFILAWRVLGLQVVMLLAKYIMSLIFIENAEIRIFTYSFFIGLFINFILAVCIFTNWLYHYYIFTEDDVSINTGFLFHKTRSFDLQSIKSVRVRQKLLGRIFNYGTIEVEIPGLSIMPILQSISDPSEWGQVLEAERLKHIERERATEIIPAIGAGK